MSYVYLGLFDKVAKWVLNHILSPITNWLGDILNDLFTWCVEKLILPAIEKILLPLIKEVGKLIFKALSGVIYRIYASLLSLLNNLNAVFDTIIGLSDVTYDGKSMTLLDLFFRDTSLSKLFWYMTFIGFALCLMFSTIAVARSAFDLDFEGKKPVSRVLSMTMRAMLTMFSMQFFVYLIVRLSGAVLAGIRAAIDYALPGNEKPPTLGGIIFAISSLNAAPDKKDNLPHASITDHLRKPYYEGTSSLTDYDTIQKLFQVDKFDYTIGFLIALFMIIIMAACLMIFVRRLFDMVVLYIVSPYFAATYPLDDGKRFERWRDLFIGKAFSGFGMVVAMKLYLMLVPLIMGNGLVFSGGSTGQASSPEFDYVVKVIFMIGGAWAILKSGPMITSLISETAGAHEDQDAVTGASVATFAGGAVLSMAKSAGAKALSSMFRGKSADGKNPETEGGGGGSNLYYGKDSQASKASSFRPKKGASAANDKESSGGLKANSAGASKEKSFNGFKAGPSALPKKKAGYFGRTQGEVQKSRFFGLWKTYKYTTVDSEGNEIQKTGSGLDLGFLKFGATKDGSGIKTPLFSYQRGADGKFSSGGFNLGVCRFKWQRGADGGRHLKDWHVLGFRSKADEETGELKFRGNSILGLSREKNEKGEYELNWSPIRKNVYATDEDTGEKHKVSQSYFFGAYRKQYSVDRDAGEWYVSGDRWFGGLRSNRYTYDAGEKKAVQVHGSSLWGLESRDYKMDPEDGKMHLSESKIGGRSLYVNEVLKKKQKPDKKESK